MLFELWASVGPAGPQFKQYCPKRRAGRRAGNRIGVFRSFGLHYRSYIRVNLCDAQFFI